MSYPSTAHDEFLEMEDDDDLVDDLADGEQSAPQDT